MWNLVVLKDFLRERTDPPKFLSSLRTFPTIKLKTCT
jgi:hypothetical protein